MKNIRFAAISAVFLLAAACSQTPKPEVGVNAVVDPCPIAVRLPGDGSPVPPECGGGGGGGGGTPTYSTVISDKAQVLDELTRLNVVSFNATTGDLTIRKIGKDPTPFAVGSILVSEPTDTLPNGLSPVEITAVTETSDVHTYKTKESSLEDVILQGKVEVDEYVQPNQISSVDFTTAGMRTQGFTCQGTPLTMTCDFTSDQNTKGKITFKLRKVFALEFTNSLKLTRFKAAVGVDQRAKVEFLNQNPSTNLAFSDVIGKFQIAQFTVKIARIPITVKMGLDLRFNAAGQVTSSTNYTLNQNVTFVKGLEYNRGTGWADINQRAYGMSLVDTATDISVRNGRLSADISAIPNIKLFNNGQFELGSAKVYSKIDQNPSTLQDSINGGIEFCPTLSFRLWSWSLPVYSGTCKTYELWRDGAIDSGSNITLFDPLNLAGTMRAPGGGIHGDWKYWEYCPQDSYASGFKLKVERALGSRRDDTALNAIELQCTSRTGASTAKITSGQGPWGEWSLSSFCTSGEFLAAYSLQVEAPQGSGDDTSANNVRMACKSSNSASATSFFGVAPVPGQSWGNWGTWQTSASVPSLTTATNNVAICGLRTKVENNQGSGDDTALNDVEFAYCAY
jgi:Vitelline membrane outer layer protein I (VOMI)